MGLDQQFPVRVDKVRASLAFLTSAPIGILGGLIGLGGAEFRLPVLVGPLGYSAKQSVPLNLAISLVTVSASLLIRSRSLSLEPVGPYLPVILALIGGAVSSAFWGPGLVGRLSNQRLERIIFFLLTIIGIALIVEAFLPQDLSGLLPMQATLRIGAGLVFGIMIGLVSSLLGVAGGELIIPTLIFAFGVDIKTAGTASLIISLPTILTGLIRYSRQGAFVDRLPFKETVAPMSLGSVIGAVVGGVLVGIVPVFALKFGLGLILIYSAYRIFRH
jgi:uncharacterized membrane protein YfcA